MADTNSKPSEAKAEGPQGEDAGILVRRGVARAPLLGVSAALGRLEDRLSWLSRRILRALRPNADATDARPIGAGVVGP